MKKSYNIILLFLVACQLAIVFWAMFFEPPAKTNDTTYRIPFLNHKSEWVHFLMQNMSTEQKIGQMVIPVIDINQSGDKDSVKKWIDEYHIGGVCFKNYPVEKQLEITAFCQQQSNIPLFFTDIHDNNIVDENNNLLIHNRELPVQKTRYSFPNPLTIGSIKNDSLLNRFAAMFANERKNFGIGIDLTPTLNLIHADDTIANHNSFGSSSDMAANKALRIAEALNKENIIACSGEFNSYIALNNDSNDRDNKMLVDSILYPYKKLSENGIPALLIDRNIKFPKSYSNSKINHLKNYLDKTLGFKGLMISPVLEDGFDLRTRTAKTIHMGTDVIVVENQINQTLATVKNLIKNRIISEEELNKRVHKILLAKSWRELQKMDSIPVNKAYQDYYSTEKQFLIRKLFEESITLIQNKNQLIPFQELGRRNFLYCYIGMRELKEFTDFFRFYSPLEKQTLVYSPNAPLAINKIKRLNKYNPIIIAIDDAVVLDTLKDKAFFQTIEKLDKQNNIVIVNFGNPLLLKNFEHIETIVQVYDNHPSAQDLAAQLLFGGIPAKGETPVYISETIPNRHRVKSQRINRFKYTMPEDAGLESSDFSMIDSIANEGIREGVTPGCQILVAKDQNVIYHKAFGYQTYKKKRPVNRFDLYDLASITKVAATTLTTMKLYEEQKIALDDSIKDYVHDTVEYAIKDIKIRELLTHQSGIQAFMPIVRFLNYRDSTTGRFGKYYKSKTDSFHTIKIAKDFYFDKRYIDTIWSTIKNLQVDTLKEYLYSDVNLNIVYHITRTKLNEPFDQYVSNNFYKQLGLNHICYCPVNYFEPQQIIPTQNDRYWRKQLLQGYVHDESAALYGGVAGNAGLFSNANDLAVLFQMLLNKGTYGGIRFFEETTVETFTTRQENSHRGLGFNFSRYGPSFGHTGFTGNSVWADPHNNLIFVFLSNRVYPDGGENKKIFEKQTRERIHQVIYDAIDKKYSPKLHKITPQKTQKKTHQIAQK